MPIAVAKPEFGNGFVQVVEDFPAQGKIVPSPSFGIQSPRRASKMPSIVLRISVPASPYEPPGRPRLGMGVPASVSPRLDLERARFVPSHSCSHQSVLSPHHHRCGCPARLAVHFMIRTGTDPAGVGSLASFHAWEISLALSRESSDRERVGRPQRSPAGSRRSGRARPASSLAGQSSGQIFATTEKSQT